MSPPVRALCCLLPAFFLATAAGHPLSVSYSRFTADGEEVSARYRLPMDDMDLLLQLDSDLDGAVGTAELQSARDRLLAYLQARAAVAVNGVSLEPELRGVSVWLDDDQWPYVEAAVGYPAPQAVDTLDIRVRLLTDLYPDHRNLAELVRGGRVEQYVFQHGNRWHAETGVAGWWQTAREFTRLGIEHIFTGFDHLLFVLGLLLVGRGLRDLIAIVTSFTVAHSLTLALATLGIVHPTGWMVEAAIALSIAYVGLENLVGRDFRRRWLIAFAFGLVHGFGFAAMLVEMRPADDSLLLALLTFNLGVEFGQVAVVALAWPLLQKLRRSQYRLPVVRLASTAILCCGLFWFVERLP
jgi:hydrogenase/urease accessory protein HupE